MNIVRYRSVDIVTVDTRSVGRATEYGSLPPSWIDFILQNEIDTLDFTSAHDQQDPHVTAQVYPYLVSGELFPEHNVLRVELSTKSPQNFLLRQFASLVGGDFVHSYLSAPLVNITYKQDHNALNLSTPPSSSWQYLFPRETLNAESITRWYHIIPIAYRQIMLSRYKLTKKTLHSSNWYGIHISSRRRRVRRRTDSGEVRHANATFKDSQENSITSAYRIELRLSVFIHGNSDELNQIAKEPSRSNFSTDTTIHFQHSNQRVPITDNLLISRLSSSHLGSQPLIERLLLHETQQYRTVFTILRPFSHPLCQRQVLSSQNCCLLSIIETMSAEIDILPDSFQFSRLDISPNMSLNDDSTELIRSSSKWQVVTYLPSFQQIPAKLSHEVSHGHKNSSEALSFNLPYCWTNSERSAHLECPSTETDSASTLRKKNTYNDVREVVMLRYQVRRRLVSSHLLPPDASYGTLLLPQTLKIISSDASAHNEYVAFSSALLLPAEIPDRTMPFNILTMIGTLWAFFIGSLINMYLKKRTAQLKKTTNNSDLQIRQ